MQISICLFHCNVKLKGCPSFVGHLMYISKMIMSSTSKMNCLEVGESSAVAVASRELLWGVMRRVVAKAFMFLVQ